MMTCKDLQTNGTVAIVGAGPAGATLARLLQKQGFSVKVFERDASSTSRSQGGSLDLRKDSGQRAVDKAGLSETFQQVSRSEAKDFKMLDSQGRAYPSGGAETHEEAGPEIDRGDLRQLLLDSLAPGTVAWGHLVKDVYLEADGRWRLEFAEQAPAIADMVVGADGVGSQVRVNEKLKQAVTEFTPTEFADQSIRSHWVLETGDPRYTWVNQTVFVAQGRVFPASTGLLGFEHQVYRPS